jgi:nucleotide-binding universal stress UspA family protein
MRFDQNRSLIAEKNPLKGPQAPAESANRSREGVLLQALCDRITEKNFCDGDDSAGPPASNGSLPFALYFQDPHPGDLSFMPACYRRILVASDLSPLPEDILQQMRSLFGPKGSDLPDEIHLAFVLEDLQNVPTEMAMGGFTLEPVAQEALARLDAIARSLGDVARNLSTGVYSGRADRTLAALAAAHPFDLILLVSHGRSLLSRIVTGSLPGSLLPLSPVPVLVLKEMSRSRELALSALEHVTGEALRPRAASAAVTVG